MNKVNFGDIIGIIDCFNDNYFLLDDGSIGIFIQVENNDDTSLPNEVILNNISRITNSFYKLLDEKTEFSFFQFPEKNQEMLDNHLNNTNKNNATINTFNSIYNKILIDKYNNFGFTKLVSVFFFRFYLSTFLIPYKNKKLSYKDYDNLVKEITTKTTLYTEALNSLNIQHHVLNVDTAFKYLSYLYNPFTYCYNYQREPIDFFYKINSLNLSKEGYTGLSLQDQLSTYAPLYPDVDFPYFVYSNKKIYMNCVRVKGITNNLKYGVFRPIMSANLPIFFISNFYVRMQGVLLGLMHASVKRKNTSLQTSSTDASKSQNEEIQQEDELLDKVQRVGNLLINGDVNFILFGKDKDLLASQSTSIISYLNTNGILANNDSGRQLYYYLNSLPVKSKKSFNSGSFDFLKVKINEFTKSSKSSRFTHTNLKRVITENLPFYCDNYDTDSGHPNPYMIFYNSLSKRPIGFDPFDQSYIPASNILIAGSTGSGKSVFANALIWKLLNRQEIPYVFTIDRGASCRHLVNILDGALLRIDPKNNQTTMNIFDTDIQDIDNPDNLAGKEKCEDIFHYIISLVYPNEVPKDIDNYKKSLLITLIQETYKSKKKISNHPFDLNVPNSFPIMQDFINILSEKIKKHSGDYSDPLFTYIRNNLKPYIKSEYSNLVNSYSPNFGTKKIMAFDVDYIFSSKTILSSELIKITSIIRNITNSLFKKSSSTKWILFIDEMWSYFMKNIHSDATSHMQYLIESGIREARKKGGLLINASQNFSDFLGTANIINNSPIKFFGKTHDRAEIKSIIETLGLNDYESSLLLNTGVYPGKCSKFFVDVSGKLRALVDIILTPIELSILTTNPDDQANIREWFEKNKREFNDIYSWIDYSNENNKGDSI